MDICREERKITAGTGWILPEKVDKVQMGQYYEGVRKGFREGSFSFEMKLEMTNFYLKAGETL